MSDFNPAKVLVDYTGSYIGVPSGTYSGSAGYPLVTVLGQSPIVFPSGTVNLDRGNNASLPLYISGTSTINNFPATQTVAGVVTAVLTGTVNTNVTNQVSITTTGSLPVSFSGVQTVTGTVSLSPQPISVTGTVTSVLTGTVNTNVTNQVAITTTGSLPVSVISIPNITGSVNVTNSVLNVTGSVLTFPTGTQTIAGTVTAVLTGTVQTSLTGTSVITGSVAVVNFPSVQTVTGTVTSVLTGTVNTNVTNQVTITTTGSLPVSFSGIQTVTGTVSLSPQPISVTGTVTSVLTGTVNTNVTNQVTVTTTGSLPVSITSIPNITGSVNVTNSVLNVTGSVLTFPTGTQTVNGTVTAVITGTLQTSLTGTSVVTGTVGITNFPSVQTITGTVSLSPQPISIIGTVTSVLTGTVNTSVTNQVTITTTGSLPVSVQTIPNITGSVNITNSILNVTGSVLAFATGTQNVVGTVTAVLTGTVQTSLTGTSVITGTVGITNFPSVQTITGTVSLSPQPITIQGTVTSILTGTVNTNITNPVLTITGSVLSIPTGTQVAGGLYNNQPQAFRTDVSGNLNVVINSAPAGTLASIAFGEITLNTANTVAGVRKTTYTEQSNNFTGSILSANAADTAVGTGARQIKITYLNAQGAGPYYETVTLNGVTPVNLSSIGDHCFIEKMEVVSVGSGGSNAGIITLKTGLAGAGTTVGTISAGDNETFWCHHYTPLGKTTYIAGSLVANNSSVVGGGCTFFLRSLALNLSGSVDKQVGDTLTLYGQSSMTPRLYTTAIPLSVGPSRIMMYVSTTSSTTIIYRASFDFYDS